MRKFPFYMQHDSMQCGITCLQMICAHWNKHYTLEQLSTWCYSTTEGVSLLGLSEAATHLGLHTQCAKVSLKQIKEIELPCILHWNQNHFVVLYRIKKKRKGNCDFYIADPGKGLLHCTESEFISSWLTTQSLGDEKGIAMLVKPTSSFFEKEGTAKRKKASLGFILSYLKPYKRYFGQIGLGLFVGSLLQLVFPFLTQSIVDIGIKYKNINFIELILVAQLMLTFSRTVVDFIRRWLLLHISMRINISLLSDFFIKLQALPMSFFDVKLTGDLLQRMDDHKRVEQFLTTQTLSVMFSLLTFIVFGVVLCMYDRFIFSVFLMGSMAYGSWVLLFMKKRKVLNYMLFEKNAENNNVTYQYITSMQEIKLQGCQQRRRWEWEDVQADLFSIQMKNLKLQQTQEAGSVLINEIKNIVITVLAATAVIHAEMSLGMMLAVQYIIGQLNAPVEQLVRFIYAVQDVRISVDRINEIHEKKIEDEHKITCDNLTENKDLVFDAVDFKYDVHSPDKTLDQINLVIPQGKVTAIVGTSGSGKTTLIKLLLGFYPVLKGEIRVGNVSLSELELKGWRKQCGVVMQDSILFSESITRNIAVDDGEVDKKKLKHAVEIAHIKEFIMKLPLKFDTKIGTDGIGLSQGQKQRMLIARAIYKNPNYIFLDEATNALDANNEKSIVENLAEFYKGKTVIVVAHRLSTVKNADQIVVMDSGKIVEMGTNQSLIEKRGVYYQLVKNQLELGN